MRVAIIISIFASCIFQAQAIAPEECQGGKKCFCMAVFGGEPACVETKQTQDEIKTAMIPSF
jgi:hypothetical protein